MRSVPLLILIFGAGVSLLAAAASREATYVVGNLDTLEPGAEGTVLVDGDGLSFRSGKVTVAVPYAAITGAELGAKLTRSSDAPLYKVWELPKRFGEKPVFQNFTVTFRDPNGKELSMTLEMTESAAAELHETLDIRTGQKARRQQEDWWGDSLWRTDRNHQIWDQSAALSSR